MSEKRILIIEDDRSLAEVIGYNLESQGFEIHISRDGMDGLQHAQLNTPDLIILDLMLPVIDGLEVCRRLRADINTEGVPILMLTAKSEETDQVVGFSVGADDYVTKPFETAEILFRLRALVRRSHGHAHPVITVGDIALDTHAGQVTRSGMPVSLTAQEFRLLSHLIHAAPRIVSRTELSEHVYDGDQEPDSNVIDVQVSRLRRKLGAQAIETIRGQGYRMNGHGEPS